MKDFDVCVIGSGPVACELAMAGYSVLVLVLVLVLEKGKWFKEEYFYKDDMACCIHEVFTPKLNEEQHVVETELGEGGWKVQMTADSSWNLWNGTLVGGSSNFMSGFFLCLPTLSILSSYFNLLGFYSPPLGAKNRQIKLRLNTPLSRETRKSRGSERVCSGGFYFSRLGVSIA